MTTAEHAGLAIDGGRLWRGLMELAEIGSYDDAGTGLRGVCRLTLTDADVAARRRVIDWMEDAGLSVRIDRIGNIYGRREGREPEAAPVMTGSHVDTVATAGAFDGPLGVVGALEVIRTLNDLGMVTRRPIEVACFTEEEGTRFGTDMLGSAVAAGRITVDDAHRLVDPNGVTLGDELERTGFLGDSHELLERPAAYVECHIEQGPVLIGDGFDVGVVTGTQGISWQEITVRGRAAHAGATPTELRADAGLAAAATVVRVRSLAESGEFGQLRATVGQMTFAPNVVNIIPAEAVFTVDLRCPDDQQMERAEAALERFIHELAEANPHLSISRRRMAKTKQVRFDRGIQALISSIANRLGLRHTGLLSGAGHDAQEMAAICPTGMIFVPGEFDGISHTPREYSNPEACATGVSVLAETVVQLAES